MKNSDKERVRVTLRQYEAFLKTVECAGVSAAAQALGVSRQTVISLEKGKYNPSLALAFKLARYFGLPIEAIFDDSDESTDATLPQ